MNEERIIKKVKRVSELDTPLEQRRQEFYDKIDQGALSLRETVVEYRYMLGKNQVDFASFVKVPLLTIQKFEQGKANPTLNTLMKMLKGSGLEVCARRKTNR